MNAAPFQPFSRSDISEEHFRQLNFGFMLLSVIAISLTPATAHEGHQPLPTRGMEVNAETGRMVLTQAARKTLDVRTAEIGPQSLSQSVLAYGTLVSPWNRHALVSSPFSGRIVELLVTPGESVTAGQRLAELDSPDLERLRLELRSAQANLALSVKLVDSTEAASRSGAIPEIRFIEAKNQMEQHQAALDIARAKWLGLQLPWTDFETPANASDQPVHQRLSLVSPIDGIVTHTDLAVGKTINPQEHVFEVLDLSTVWLKIGVLEKDLAKVAVGQSFELTLTAYPGETFVGKLDVIGQRFDPVTHLGTVWASLSNHASSAPRLLPGMSGQVQLRTGDASHKVVVPLSAVIRDGAERFVLVEEDRLTLHQRFKSRPWHLASEWAT